MNYPKSRAACAAGGQNSQLTARHAISCSSAGIGAHSGGHRRTVPQLLSCRCRPARTLGRATRWTEGLLQGCHVPAATMDDVPKISTSSAHYPDHCTCFVRAAGYVNKDPLVVLGSRCGERVGTGNEVRCFLNACSPRNCNTGRPPKHSIGRWCCCCLCRRRSAGSCTGCAAGSRPTHRLPCMSRWAWRSWC